MAELTGRLLEPTIDFKTGRLNLIFAPNEDARGLYEELKDCDKLSLKISKYRAKRSLNANALLWACIGDIAKVMNPPADKWDIYLLMLNRYGKYTYIVVKPNMVESVKKVWRECEVVGDIDMHGEKGVQMLCYFGSSTYDTKEMSVLIDGVVSEMKEMGLQPPVSKDMKRSLEEWARIKKE